jgi:hypothetical protein
VSPADAHQPIAHTTPAAKTDWLADTTHLNDTNGNLTKKDDRTNVSSYKYDFRNLMTDYDGLGTGAESVSSWCPGAPGGGG